jgi:hypothetical protein
MFRTLATTSAERDTLLRLHPAELAVLLETAWNQRRRHAAGSPPATPDLGHPDNRSAIPGLGLPVPKVVETPPGGTPQDRITPFLTKLGSLSTPPVNGGPIQGVVWPHLIYAYMIENTRIFEIFRRVIRELVHGEKLGAPNGDAVEWIRTTEEFLYRDPPPFLIQTINSDIRSDMGATRRNAYQRMFGMDLNHGTDDNSPYAYTRASNANSEFVSTFEELLREVWIGITYANSQTGANPTDASKIAELAQNLRNMLTSRRQTGNLSREEFVAVSMMSWLHLTISGPSPIAGSLRADTTSPEEILFKIASQVGLPAHAHSNAYFRIADPLAGVLTLIETNTVEDATAARALFDEGVDPALPGTMGTIITHWSTITGRDMKAGKVATS